MEIAIEQIKQLRQETGVGVLKCRQALEQAEGDYARAVNTLREHMPAFAPKAAERVALQGRLELYAHNRGRIGVMVEINTETDFAARSESFGAFTHEIALQIAAAAPLYVSDADIPVEVLDQEAEKAAAAARNLGKAEALIARIVAGSLDKYRDETVLLRQPYIRDDNITIEQLLRRAIAGVGERVVIRRFVRWELSDSELEA